MQMDYFKKYVYSCLFLCVFVLCFFCLFFFPVLPSCSFFLYSSFLFLSVFFFFSSFFKGGHLWVNLLLTGVDVSPLSSFELFFFDLVIAYSFFSSFFFFFIASHIFFVLQLQAHVLGLV